MSITRSQAGRGVMRFGKKVEHVTPEATRRGEFELLAFCEDENAALGMMREDRQRRLQQDRSAGKSERRMFRTRPFLDDVLFERFTHATQRPGQSVGTRRLHLLVKGKCFEL